LIAIIGGFLFLALIVTTIVIVTTRVKKSKKTKKPTDISGHGPHALAI
jgi:hypothetical protein